MTEYDPGRAAEKSDRSGRCMCGSVRFRASAVPGTFGVCHCEMCRRWTGSALLGVTVPTANIVWLGEDRIATVKSSSWAMRAWCRDCGANLYFRVTADGPYADDTEIPLGLFDDPGGFHMTHEIYIDHKPDSFAYEGEGRKQMTRQDCVDKFSLLDGE